MKNGIQIPESVNKYIMAECLSALEQTHKRGILHKDIKPDNIFLKADGKLKVGDFGVSC